MGLDATDPSFYREAHKRLWEIGMEAVTLRKETVEVNAKDLLAICALAQADGDLPEITADIVRKTLNLYLDGQLNLDDMLS